MAVELGTFAEGFQSWRNVLAGVPESARLTVFEEAAREIAQYVRKGLDKVVAVDELHDMAIGLNVASGDQDVIQGVIARAFYDVGEQDRVPDDEIGEIERPSGKTNGKAAPGGIRFMSKADFIRGFVAPDYLVEGILQRRFVYSLTGQTGHAKTAIALLLAELVSSPDPNATLGRHRVEKGAVLYFAGENADDIRMRVIGADSLRDDDNTLADRITFIPGQFNIGQMFKPITEYCRNEGRCDLVIVDTSAAYFLGNEELNNIQMGNHARMLRKLTELPGAPCVLVLCHPIKYASEPGQLLPRGGGAFLAEMDGNLTAWKHDETLIELHHNKLRGPGFEPLSFRLDRITTDSLVDQKGRHLPTVRALAISQSDEDKQTTKTRLDEDTVLTVKLKTDGQNLSIAELANRCGWTYGDGSPAKSRAQKILDRLEKAKPPLAYRDRGQWLLTEKGRDAARKAALRTLVDESARNQITMELH